MAEQWDLMLTRRRSERSIGDRELVDLDTERQDLATLTGRTNLTQAILNRLHTRKGEMTSLGHPDYGSRLYELISEPNNNRTRLLAELYIRDCLAQESRIAKVVEVIFAPSSRSVERDALNGVVIVIPTDNPAPLSLNLSLNLGE